jgi:hypothetical protein
VRARCSRGPSLPRSTMPARRSSTELPPHSGPARPSDFFERTAVERMEPRRVTTSRGVVRGRVVVSGDRATRPNSQSVTRPDPDRYLDDGIANRALDDEHGHRTGSPTARRSPDGSPRHHLFQRTADGRLASGGLRRAVPLGSTVNPEHEQPIDCPRSARLEPVRSVPVDQSTRTNHAPLGWPPSGFRADCISSVHVPAGRRARPPAGATFRDGRREPPTSPGRTARRADHWLAAADCRARPLGRPPGSAAGSRSRCSGQASTSADGGGRDGGPCPEAPRYRPDSCDEAPRSTLCCGR